MLKFRMFGSIQVEDEDRGRVLGPRDLGGRKPRQLLEILLIEEGRTVSKQRLADLLWGDRRPQNHAATLESYVSVLRKTLQPGVAPKASILVTEAGGYRLAREEVWVDMDAFGELLAKAEAAEPLAAVSCFAAAVALVRGDILEDDPYADWVQELREVHRQTFLGALVSAGECSLAVGDAISALRFAERALNHDATVEAAARVAMLSYYSLGRQQDAVRIFQHCCQALDEELGVTPMHDTLSLHQAIERHDTGILRGLSSSAPAVDAEAFLGREAELDELHAAIDDAIAGTFSVVAIEAEAGFGATRFLAEARASVTDVTTGGHESANGDRPGSQLPILDALEDAIGPSEVTAAIRAGLEPMSVGRGSLAVAGPDQVRALEALAGVVRENAPLVLFVDAADSVSTASISMLRYLEHRCQATPAAVVLTCRPSDSTDEALGLLDATTRIRLDALTSADLAAAGLEDAHDTTGGYPLLVADAIRRSDDDREELSADVVDRLARYCFERGWDAAGVLSASAQHAEPFAAAQVAIATGAHVSAVVEALETLQQVRLLDAHGPLFSFRDDSVRRTLQSLVPQPSDDTVIDLTAVERCVRSAA